MPNKKPSKTAKSSKSSKAKKPKYSKTHKLVQTWVSLELWNALAARAKKEGRALSNYVRWELSKVGGVPLPEGSA